VEPSTNEQLGGLARRIAERNLFDEVTAAFHHGRPTFATVLDTLTADEVIVVPVMTSAGYYSEVVLRRELARNRRFHEVRTRRTVPIGTHPQIVDLVSNRLERLAQEYDLDPERTTVAVVGHGTASHADSRRATEALAESLTRRRNWGQILAAFLDEEPVVETILQRANEASVVVIPFLISGGPHATVDIPMRLGLPCTGAPVPPFLVFIDSRWVVVDRAIGMDPRIEDLIVDIAMRSIDLAPMELETVR